MTKGPGGGSKGRNAAKGTAMCLWLRWTTPTIKEGLREPWFPFHAESSAIGCNAEFNEIKIIISVLKHPININGLCCLRSGRLRGLHIACIELVFEPDWDQFF